MNLFQRLFVRTSLAVLTAAALSMPALEAQAPGEIQKAVDAAYAKYRTLKEGANADYIPALAKVDSNIYGIAVVTPDGKLYTAGDLEVRGVHPVDLEGVHDGEGHGGVRHAGPG